MAAKKKPVPDLAYCPFCKDGGEPFFKSSAAFDSCGCKTCGVTFEGPGCIEKWNTRFFLTAPAKMAAYNALVNVAAMRQLWVERAQSGTGKKRVEAGRDAFVSAAVGFLTIHGGIIRSLLNEVEGKTPLKKKGGKNGIRKT